ncbi:MAG: sirohydrochlorin cobaltochelatase [Clostridiaceae bacterium]
MYFQGEGEKQLDNYKVFIKAIEEIIPKDKAIVFMGNGISHIANDFYGCLEKALKDNGKNNVYIGTVENYPTLNTVIKNLKKDNVKELLLAPLFLIFRFHDKKDMIGSDEGSWKNILKREGFNVETLLRSLGELDNFQNIYINHVKDTIAERYNDI